MKYLYYSLYMFYTKILSVHQYHPPIISIVGILAALQVFLLTSIVDAYFFIETKEILIVYPTYIPLLIWLLLYKLNENYFSQREEKIIKKVGEKNAIMKILIFLLSFIFVIMVFWLSFRHGLYQIVVWLFPSYRIH